MTAVQQTILTLLVTATLLPLASSVFNILLGKRLLGNAMAWVATVLMFAASGCALYAASLWLKHSPETIVWNIPWIPLPGNGAGAASWLYLGAMVDSLTIAMMAMVTFVAALVHLYSIGYMAGDSRYTRFFAYLSLFSFSMLGIVMSNSIMELFVFWELVGLTSYLLIGFWFEKQGPRLACKKAFVMNRVGDMGFLIGFGLLFYHLKGALLLPATGDKSMFMVILEVIKEKDPSFSILNPPLWLTMAGIGLFFGAIGKSAQFPLHTWLPDAMEGPTPVSSIVHSATMVAAGVYLTARIYPILTPSAHLFVASIGLITLVMAAAMAMVMTDIKRVLAYSTLSQLGYMVLGLGAGAYGFALFHLITHAFFKCCLFQCSGSVIHGAHHEQDMRYYGGLAKKMPLTAAAYFICTLAIAGASIPYTIWGVSGFYSKDGIIAGTVNFGSALEALGPAAKLFYLAPIVVAYVTVFYMGRSFALTFLGKPRKQELYDHAHEAPWQMVVPQLVLAALALFAATLPFLALIQGSEPKWLVDGQWQVIPWVQQVGDLEAAHHGAMGFTHSALLHGLGWILSLGLALVIYTPGMKIAAKIARIFPISVLYTWAHNKFYFDALYDIVLVNATKGLAHVCAFIDKFLVDGLVNGVALATAYLADRTGLFDNKIVDGAVNGAANAARNGGEILRSTQQGRVRGYVLLMFSASAVATLLVLVVVLSR